MPAILTIDCDLCPADRTEHCAGCVVTAVTGGPTQPTQPDRFPAAPIVAVLERRRLDGRSDHQAKHGPAELARTFNLSGTRARHWLNAGLTLHEADRAAVRLGYHPCELWGSAWAPDDRSGAERCIWCRKQVVGPFDPPQGDLPEGVHVFKTGVGDGLVCVGCLDGAAEWNWKAA